MTPFSKTILFGNEGLDHVLNGGLPAHRLYLLEGTPGAGKTTLALEFLREGVRCGEKTLYVTLSETAEELSAVAQSHGWSLDDFSVLELSAVENSLAAQREQSILHPWELELSQTVALIKQEVERVQPTRVVLDSLSEMRLLAQDPLRYRRQVLALKQYFSGRSITVVMVDDMSATSRGHDNHLHSLCHGVITLYRLTLDFGAARRRLQVQKLRGVDFVAGYHDFVIKKGGLAIYPRLIASTHTANFRSEPVPSGLPELDSMLSGGPLRGTCVLIAGPAGSGKTTIALQYLFEACTRGEACTLYEFDERIGTLLSRAEAFNLNLRPFLDDGTLVIEQIDPAEISPGEFAHRVRQQVEQRGARIIALDSLNGYLAAMAQEQQLILQMHELLAYLSSLGVLTLLINPQRGVLANSDDDLNVSYVADSVVLLRFFETAGRIRKAISVVKNRSGGHEDTIREFRVDSLGLRIGTRLADFHRVLSGTPEYGGRTHVFLEDRANDA